MTQLAGIDWDDAFANAVHIHDGVDYPALWAQAASAFRDTARARLDLRYGPAPRECLDLFLPDGAARGLVLFVHGGFWLRFDKSFWSHLAAGALARGHAVAMPSYTLAPEAGLPQMTAQIARALELAAGLVDGPIHLAGHSAGGHLVTRMICADLALSQPVRGRIARVVSISGLHDLRPLQLTQMNAQLGLTPEIAQAESPALQRPVPGIPVIAWVGGHERPEFLRQSALLRASWASSRQGAAADIALVVEDGLHHFDVIASLARADSALVNALLAGS